MLGNSHESWGGVQRFLHWFVVALVLTQLVVGMMFGALPNYDPFAKALFPVHATVGLTIGVLMVVRLVWRLINPVPKLPDSLGPWEKRMAHANHWLLYIVTIGLPIVGFLMISASGESTPFFRGSLAPTIPPDPAFAAELKTWHTFGVAVLALLVTAHVLAALRHGYVLKDGVLFRMAPFLKPSPSGRPDESGDGRSSPSPAHEPAPPHQPG